MYKKDNLLFWICFFLIFWEFFYFNHLLQWVFSLQNYGHIIYKPLKLFTKNFLNAKYFL